MLNLFTNDGSKNELEELKYCISELNKNNIKYTVNTINSSLLMEINDKVKSLIEETKVIARRKGYYIAITGGFVRDLFLRRSSKDVDFIVFKGDLTDLTETLSIKLNAKIGKMSNKTLTTQLRFSDDIIFEFNETRTERYETNSRVPTVNRGSLIEDLYRRDFTINALLMIDDKCIDIFDGLKDLSNKLIQTTREPAIVFKEDYLRMFRAIRFACELDFEIAEYVKEGIMLNVNRILNVHKERILHELQLSLKANETKTFDLMVELKLMQVLFPEVVDKQLDPKVYRVNTVYDKIKAKFAYLKRNNNIDNINVFLATILMEMKNTHKDDLNARIYELDKIKSKLKSMKFSKKDIWTILLMIKYSKIIFHFAEMSGMSVLDKRLFLQDVGEQINNIIALNLAENEVKMNKNEFLEHIIDELRELQKNKELIFVNPAISGSDIKELFNVEGHRIKELKDALILAIMGEKIQNTREECINFLKQYIANGV